MTIGGMPLCLGRRGFVLLVLAAAWAAKAYSLFANFPAPLLNEHLLGIPLADWGWMWAVCAGICFIFAWVPDGKDRLGYAAALLPSVIWAVGYFYAWVLEGHPGSWVQALIWGAFAVAVLELERWHGRAEAMWHRDRDRT